MGEKLLPFACFHPDSSFPGTPYTSCVTRDAKWLLYIHLSTYSTHHLPVFSHADNTTQQPGPCICMIPVPSRASSSPATSLFQCSPYPGWRAQRFGVDKYTETAISSDFWSDRRLHHRSHKRRQGKRLQDATGAKKRRLHLAKQKLLKTALIGYGPIVCPYAAPSSAIAPIRNETANNFPDRIADNITAGVWTQI